MDDDQLIELAGPRAFERGQRYQAEGRVALLRAGERSCKAAVRGTERYHASLRTGDGDWRWSCECPAAEDGSFCKHLVATAIEWRGTPSMAAGPQPGATGPQLLERLRALPGDRLAEWLHEAALEDPVLEQRLETRLAGDDPAALQSALDALLRVRGFLDSLSSLDYARQLDDSLEPLQTLIARDPAGGLRLAERALKRLFRILEQADDSTGALFDAVAEFATLHARAAAHAGAKPAQLARTLHELKQRDEWDFLPLSDYWEALGERGRAAYRTRVEKEYAALDPPARSGGRSVTDAWIRDYPVLQRREEVARCEHDCDALIEIYARDVFGANRFERIVAACREFGREAEATRWAEQGVREHPESARLRTRLADCYREAGLVEEAIDQLRASFRLQPEVVAWMNLRETAGDQWPRQREESLAEVAGQEAMEADRTRRDVTLRVELLEADGDIDAAVDLALQHAVRAGVLTSVADQAAGHRPLDAAALLRRAVDIDLKPTDARGYPAVVRKIARVQALAPSAETGTWVAALRKRYQARRKLMQLLDDAGL